VVTEAGSSVKREAVRSGPVKSEAVKGDSGRKRSREPKSRRRKTPASAPRACRRDGSGGVGQKFELITASIMSAAVRKMLKHIDPRAETCGGPGSQSCMANASMEMECEVGVCANRAVQRGRFVPTESMWCGDKGWGLRLVADAKKDELVEEYVGEVIEPGEFWDRFQSLSGSEPMYFVEFVHGLIIDARLKGSFARLINHSCEPNAQLRQWSVKGARHVVVSMLCDAQAGDEVTIAYRDPVTSRQWRCKCGKDSCVNSDEGVRVMRTSGVAVPSEGVDDDVVILSDGEC